MVVGEIEGEVRGVVRLGRLRDVLASYKAQWHLLNSFRIGSRHVPGSELELAFLL